MTFKRDDLRDALEEAFDADAAVIEDVVDQAVELRDSGKWEEVSDTELTAEFIVEKLEVKDRALQASWNMWLGELDYVGEDGFRVYQLR